MNIAGSRQGRIGTIWMTAALALSLCGAPALAQIRTTDPNTAIDADLAPGAPAADTSVRGTPPTTNQAPPPPPPPPSSSMSDPAYAASAAPADNAAQPTEQAAASASAKGAGYKRDDLIGAAEGVFGKGAEGLAAMIESILKDQGEPIGYITGREAAGAIGIGLRYGSGTLFHKIEGERPVYWTGPSLGFDLGGNAGKSFVLVYNLFDSQNLYKRFPAGEGALYFIGGFNASYLRRGNVVLIPIRMGVGYRFGANIGYMKFSEKPRILPF